MSCRLYCSHDHAQVGLNHIWCENRTAGLAASGSESVAHCFQALVLWVEFVQY